MSTKEFDLRTQHHDEMLDITLQVAEAIAQPDYGQEDDDAQTLGGTQKTHCSVCCYKG